MIAAKPERLRVVLDSNVYVSAFAYPEGAISWLWLQAVRRRYTLIVSPPIVAEVAASLRLDFEWEEKRIVRRMKLLVKLAAIVVPKITLTVSKDDPDDNRILECAVAGRASLIVSGDRHLTKLKSFREIGIVRPIDFRRMLGS